MKYVVVYIKVLLSLFVSLNLLQAQESLSTVQVHTIHSDILQEDRSVSIYLPDGFYGMDETNQKYPVLYLVDGEGLFLPIVGIVDQMSSPFTANDLIPRMIVVGISNTNRNRDLTPSKAMMGNDPSTLEITGGALKFIEFIEEELVPYVDEKYPTAPHRTLLGHSLGGLLVLKTLIAKPKLFSNYLCIDPDLSWNQHQFAKEVIDSLKLKRFSNQHLFLASANTSMPWMTMEDIRSDTTDILRITRSNLLFKDELSGIKRMKLDIEDKYYEDENHFQIPIKATYDGLQYLFNDYSYNPMLHYYYPDSEQSKIDIVEDITKHFERLSDKMGYTVLPLESYINSWAFGFLSFGKAELTEQLLDLNIKNYPESKNVYKAKETFITMQKE